MLFCLAEVFSRILTSIAPNGHPKRKQRGRNMQMHRTKILSKEAITKNYERSPTRSCTGFKEVLYHMGRKRQKDSMRYL